MMCLGWSTRADCQAMAQQTVGTVQGDGSVAAVNPDITWFWILAGALGLGLVSGKNKA
jgi:hypothetical protein